MPLFECHVVYTASECLGNTESVKEVREFETAYWGRFLRILSWGGKRREKAGGKASPAALMGLEALRVKWDQ